MGKRIEMEAAEKEYLIQECLAGRMRMREAARRAGVGRSTMHTWISRYRAEGASALCENGNAQRRTYSEEIRQKAVEEYLSGLGSAMAIAEKYKLRSGNLVLDWVKEYHRHRENRKETGGISMTSRKHTLAALSQPPPGRSPACRPALCGSPAFCCTGRGSCPPSCSAASP